ncbi:MAG: ABC transporter ATP-binding protein [Candidatus Kapaibacterium sp.]
MTKVILNKISKVFPDGTRAVDSADFEVESGEFLVLVGPSGCGKSTLLRMIAGLEDITGGDLYFDDRRMNEERPRDRDVGMVFQNYALYPHMTVRQNIEFPLKIHKMAKKLIDSRVREIAGMLGLDDRLDHKPKQLSGGQRQRVALGRAIVRKPRVFLFDEPLSNLDARLRVQMRTEILYLQKEVGSTAIYVTHDQTEAMTMGERIVVLRDGVVQQIAPPAELYNEPANLFVAGFIGSPQMNFFEGKIERDNGIIFIEDGGPARFKIDESAFLNDLPKPGQTVTAGIRPENIFPAKTSVGEGFEADLTNVEYLGHEVLLYFRTQGELKCCRTDRNLMANAGERYAFRPDPKEVKIFNKEGERT